MITILEANPPTAANSVTSLLDAGLTATLAAIKAVADPNANIVIPANPLAVPPTPADNTGLNASGFPETTQQIIDYQKSQLAAELKAVKAFTSNGLSDTSSGENGFSGPITVYGARVFFIGAR